MFLGGSVVALSRFLAAESPFKDAHASNGMSPGGFVGAHKQTIPRCQEFCQGRR